MLFLSILMSVGEEKAKAEQGSKKITKFFGFFYNFA